MLHKIHKRVTRIPGRLVFNCCGTLTEIFQNLLIFILLPLLGLCLIYIKDTVDFLFNLKGLGDIKAEDII